MLRHRSIEKKRYCSTSGMQTHKRWATCVQAALTEMGWLLLNPRCASAATTLGRDKCPSTSAATDSPPARWKALGASVKGRQRPNRPGSAKQCRRDGRIVLGKKRRLQRTPVTNNLSDHPGIDFTPSAPVQTSNKGPSSG